MTNHLNICFQNVRSLQTVSSSRNELWNLKHTVSLGNAEVYSLVETWLDNKVLDAELEIDGYNVFRKDRGSRGGGVLVYVSKKLQCVRRLDLESASPTQNEIIINEIRLDKKNSILLVTFYRPPNADQAQVFNFREENKQLLQKTNKQKKE